jgi:hypothetical protein
MKWPNTLIVVGGSLAFLGGVLTLVDGHVSGLVGVLAGLALVGFGVRRARLDGPGEPEQGSDRQRE